MGEVNRQDTRAGAAPRALQCHRDLPAPLLRAATVEVADHSARTKAGPPSLPQVVADFGSPYGIGALAAFIFAASGPVAVILTVATRGGLKPSDVASWIFGGFLVNGLVSIAFC